MKRWEAFFFFYFVVKNEKPLILFSVSNLTSNACEQADVVSTVTYLFYLYPSAVIYFFNSATLFLIAGMK